jgi:hypothetical protein
VKPKLRRKTRVSWGRFPDQRCWREQGDPFGRVGVQVVARSRRRDGSGTRGALGIAVRYEVRENRDEVLLAFEVAARRILDRRAQPREVGAEHGMTDDEVTWPAALTPTTRASEESRSYLASNCSRPASSPACADE